MGCDIHFVLEKKINGSWIGLGSTDYGYRPEAKNRNYEFFSAIANVRGEGNGKDPKGLPGNLSVLSALLNDSWGVDGHSHSWLSLKEFCRKWWIANGKDHSRSEYIVYDALSFDDGDDSDDPFWMDNYRVVFLFDN